MIFTFTATVQNTNVTEQTITISTVAAIDTIAVRDETVVSDAEGHQVTMAEIQAGMRLWIRGHDEGGNLLPAVEITLPTEAVPPTEVNCTVSDESAPGYSGWWKRMSEQAKRLLQPSSRFISSPSDVALEMA